MSEPTVTGIVLNIGGERKEISLEDARKLREALNALFGEPAQPTVSPYWWPTLPAIETTDTLQIGPHPMVPRNSPGNPWELTCCKASN